MTINIIKYKKIILLNNNFSKDGLSINTLKDELYNIQYNEKIKNIYRSLKCPGFSKKKLFILANV